MRINGVPSQQQFRYWRGAELMWKLRNRWDSTSGLTKCRALTTAPDCSSVCSECLLNTSFLHICNSLKRGLLYLHLQIIKRRPREVDTTKITHRISPLLKTHSRSLQSDPYRSELWRSQDCVQTLSWPLTSVITFASGVFGLILCWSHRAKSAVNVWTVCLISEL